VTLLIVETSSRIGSVALVQGGKLLDEAKTEAGPRKSADVIPLLHDLLNAHPSSRPEMILAGVGPGSYTGLRMGISAALGLSLALNIECRAIPSWRGIGATDRILWLIGDAGRGLVYRLPRHPENAAASAPIDLLAPDIFASWRDSVPLASIGRLGSLPKNLDSSVYEEFIPSAFHLAESFINAPTPPGPVEPIYLQEACASKPEGSAYAE